MADAIILRSGYDFEQRIRVELNKVVQNVAGATIKASVKSYTKTIELINEVTQSEVEVGADWVNGQVVLKFLANLTGQVKTFGPAWIEVAITKDGYTYPGNDIPIVIERGFAM